MDESRSPPSLNFLPPFRNFSIFLSNAPSPPPTFVPHWPFLPVPPIKVSLRPLFSPFSASPSLSLLRRNLSLLLPYFSSSSVQFEMSKHFLFLALLFFVGQISAKSIHSKSEEKEDPFFGEETDGTEEPQETDEPKPYGWENIYEKCMDQFDDHKKCCEVSGGGDECLLEDTTTEAGETTTEEPEYSDETFKKCMAKLNQSKDNCCFIFEDKKLKECEHWQPQTTTETAEEPDNAYAKCLRRGYYAEECCRKYPLASQCSATTTQENTYGGDMAEEFERCKSVSEVEKCCDLFEFASDLEECGYWEKKMKHLK